MTRIRLAARGLLLLLVVLAGCSHEPANPNINPVHYQQSKADLRAAARTNTELGMEYARRQMLDVAQDKLKKAIDQDDTYGPAHATLAYVYAERGMAEDADREYRRAIELDGDNPDTRNNYGVFLCSQRKRADADRNFMLAAGNRNYTTPEAAWTNAAVCAHAAGDVERAEGDLRQALQRNPDFPDALAEMARISFERQEYLRARAFLERYDKQGKPNPAMLALGVKTERALGNAQGARDYELRLVRSFPESAEAAQLGPTTAPSNSPDTSGR